MIWDVTERVEMVTHDRRSERIRLFKTETFAPLYVRSSDALSRPLELVVPLDVIASFDLGRLGVTWSVGLRGKLGPLSWRTQLPLPMLPWTEPETAPTELYR